MGVYNNFSAKKPSLRQMFPLLAMVLYFIWWSMWYGL